MTKAACLEIFAFATVLCSLDASAATVSVPIYWDQTYQWIDGFGAAQPGGQHYCANEYDNSPFQRLCTKNADCGSGICADWQDFATSFFADPDKSAIMDQLFSTLDGIGLSILRMKVSPVLEWEPYVFDTKLDEPQAWIMQQAAARGPVKIMASVWSPPPWMKTNSQTLGGYCSITGDRCVMSRGAFPDADPPVPGLRCSLNEETCISAELRPDKYQVFADLLSFFAKDYAAAMGVDIYALSFTNEPDTMDVYWDTCAWNGATIARFLAEYLAPTFARNHVTTRVIAPETAGWNYVDVEVPMLENPTRPMVPEPYLVASSKNPAARNRIDIAAAHLYGPNDDPARQFTVELNPQTHVWQTETAGYGCDRNNTCWACPPNVTPPDARCKSPTQLMLKELKIMHKSLTGAWASASVWFRAYPGGLLGKDNAGLFRTKMYYAMGNFSKFVRPGFQRIGAPANPASELYISAYKDYVMDAGGPLVIVAINAGTSSRTVSFKNVPRWATPHVTSSTHNLSRLADVYLGSPVTIPPQSVVTYVANPPHRSDDILFEDGDGNTMTWQSALASTASHPGKWGPDWEIAGAGEFDGDVFGDLLLRNMVDGRVKIWHNGEHGYMAWETDMGAPSLEWQIKGVGDFDHNGKSDILWRSQLTGEIVTWQDGTPAGMVRRGVLPAWQVAGAGDFDGNGFSDILLRASGATAIWLDADSHKTLFFALPDDGWTIQGVGEFDQNGKSDIVWRHVSGSTAIWHDGTAMGTYPGPLPNDWKMQAVGDFDGNGLSDFLWHNDDGNLAIWHDGNAGWTTWPGNPGGTWKVKGAAKLDR